MKYLSTVLVMSALVALVFGFAFNLTSLAPQFPQLEVAQNQTPKAAVKKAHHHKRKLASMGLPLPAPQDQAAQAEATPSSDAAPAPDAAASATSQASVDPESLAVDHNPDAEGQDSRLDDVPMN